MPARPPGGGGSGPETDPVAGPALDSHKAATAAVHGIPDTAALVEDTDPRLTDARAPTAHGHAIGDVTNLQASLDGKAAAAHAHAVADVTGLQAALDAKQDDPGAWTALAYAAAYADLGGAFRTGAVRVEGDVTRLRGIAKRSTGNIVGGELFFTLPAAARPAVQTTAWTMVNATQVNMLIINTDGTVVWNAGGMAGSAIPLELTFAR